MFLKKKLSELSFESQIYNNCEKTAVFDTPWHFVTISTIATLPNSTFTREKKKQEKNKQTHFLFQFSVFIQFDILQFANCH